MKPPKTAQAKVIKIADKKEVEKAILQAFEDDELITNWINEKTKELQQTIKAKDDEILHLKREIETLKKTSNYDDNLFNELMERKEKQIQALKKKIEELGKKIIYWQEQYRKAKWEKK